MIDIGALGFLYYTLQYSSFTYLGSGILGLYGLYGKNLWYLACKRLLLSKTILNTRQITVINKL